MHDRRGYVGPQAGGHVEHARQSGAGGQRPLGGPLDDRAVGQRIGERHADFDDIGAGAIERPQDRRPTARDRDRRR